LKKAGSRKTEVRRQKTEVRRRKSEDGRQKSEVRRGKIEAEIIENIEENEINSTLHQLPIP